MSISNSQATPGAMAGVLPITPDFEDWPVHHQAVGVSTDGNVVSVTWDDGRVSRYHAVWLRDNATDPGSLNPVTREQERPPWSYPADLTARHVQINASGAVIVSFEPEGEDIPYHPGWLRGVDYSGGHRDDLAAEAAIPWIASDLTAAPAIDGPGFLDDDQCTLGALETLARRGLVKLEGTATAEGTVQRYAERIGTIRNSNFGLLFDVVTAPLASRKTANSNAYLSVELPPHTDLSTREYEPGLQLLHCRRNTTVGGNAVYVDGFAVAEEIRRRDADLWRAITEIPWTFTNRSTATDYRWRSPLVVLDTEGNPSEVRMTTFLRGPLNVPFEAVELAYAGLRAFQELANSERFRLTFAYQPGDLMIFDNRRILHGRGAFDEAIGDRALQGCYMEREEVLSRIRILRRNLATGSRSG